MTPTEVWSSWNTLLTKSFLSKSYVQAHMLSVILRKKIEMCTVEGNALFILQKNHMIGNSWVIILHVFDILKS